MVPSRFIQVKRPERTSPPTTSIPMSYLDLDKGWRNWSNICSRLIMVFAPIDDRKSCESFLDVTAVTRAPSFDKRYTERQPTPPLAPVTMASFSMILFFCSKSFIHMPAVRPAVPIPIDCSKEIFDGSFNTHSSGTRMYSAKPPEVFIPRS